jgi:hypothetical protein
MERPVRAAPVLARRFVMPRHESPMMAWVTRGVIVASTITIMLCSWSAYRRIWQVLRLDLAASTPVLASGTTVSADVITTGEVPNPMRLELIQGSRRETLWEGRGKLPTVRSFDPRLYRYTPRVLITRELLAQFVPGEATLRLTGFGMQKLLRTPPDRVRELRVTLPPG